MSSFSSLLLTRPEKVRSANDHQIGIRHTHPRKAKPNKATPRVPVQRVDACPVGMTEYRMPSEGGPLRKILNEIATVRVQKNGRESFCLPTNEDRVSKFANDAAQVALNPRVSEVDHDPEIAAPLREKDRATLRRQLEDLHRLDNVAEDFPTDLMGDRNNTNDLQYYIGRYLNKLRYENLDEQEERREQRRAVKGIMRALQGGDASAMVERFQGGAITLSDNDSSSTVSGGSSDESSYVSDSEASVSSVATGGSLSSYGSDASQTSLRGGARQVRSYESLRSRRTKKILEIARMVRHNLILMRCLNLYLVQQRWALLMLLEAQRRLDLTNNAIMQEQIRRNVVDLQQSPIRTLLVPLELEHDIINYLATKDDDDEIISKQDNNGTEQATFTVPQVVEEEGHLKVEKLAVWIFTDDSISQIDDRELLGNKKLFHDSVQFDGPQSSLVISVDVTKLVQLQELEEVRIRRSRDTEADARETVYTIAYPEPSIVIWLKCAGDSVACESREAGVVGNLFGRKTALCELANMLHEHFMYTPKEDNERLLAHRDDKLGVVHWAHVLRRSRKCIDQQMIKETQKDRKAAGTVGVGLRVQTQPSSRQRQIAKMLSEHKFSRRSRQIIENAAAAAAAAAAGAQGAEGEEGDDRTENTEEMSQGALHGEQLGGGCRSYMSGGDFDSSDSDSSVRGGCRSDYLSGGCGLPWSTRISGGGAPESTFLGY